MRAPTPALTGAEAPAGGGRLRNVLSDYGPALCLLVATVAAVEAVSLLAPSNAQADLNPFHWIGSLLSGATGLTSSLFVRGFVAILNALFSGFEAKLTLGALTWLTSIANQDGSNIVGLYRFTSGMSLGLLGAVLTVSIARYWISGLSQSGSGGFEALEGLLRTLAAVAFLLVWPYFFSQLVALANTASGTVLSDPALRSQVATLINTVVDVTFVPGGQVGLFLGIVVAVAGALLFLGLLFLKVMLGAAITFLYVAMPLAIIVWPIDELAWLARYAMRAFIAMLIIPTIWALIFATFAAVTVNALRFSGAHGFINQVTQPLVAIAMLWLTITIPRTLFKMASGGLGLGRHGGGFISRAGSYLAARQAGEFLAQGGYLPFGRGGFATADAAGNGAGGGPAGSILAGQQGTRSGNRAGGDGVRTNTSQEPALAAIAAAAAAAADPTGGAAAAAHAATAAEALTSAAEETAGSGQSSPAPQPAAGADTSADAASPGSGKEKAIGPSVGAYRPSRDADNPVAMRPSMKPANQPALQEAVDKARNSQPPTLGEATAASSRLGDRVIKRLAQSYDEGGAARAQSDMALLSASDRISNSQANDLMTVARAGSAPGMIETLLGIPVPGDPAARSVSAPSQGSALPGAGGAPNPTTPPAAPGKPEATPGWTPETSADRATRDRAWRSHGTGVDPRQD